MPRRVRPVRCDDVAFVGKCLLFGRGKFVVGLGGDGHGRGGASQAVPDAPVVLGPADDDADGFVRVLAPEHVVDERHVEVELAAVFGLEFAGLELDDDVAR
jgi:hypothetical protein